MKQLGKIILSMKIFFILIYLGLNIVDVLAQFDDPSLYIEIKKIEDLPSDFPSNCIVREYWPSAIAGDYIFYPDGSFIFQDLSGASTSYSVGIWLIDKDNIKINTHKIVGSRPIGEPLNPEVSYADNPDVLYEFETYEDFEYWINEEKILSLKDFFLSGDPWLLTHRQACTFKVNVDEYSIPGQYKQASCKKLNNNDLKDLDKQELRLMRNEIFARYGYKFKSIDLQKYFISKDWYHGYATNVDKYLTDIEKQNIELISKFEQK